MKILVVDDDDITLAMTENILANSGFEVILARNGQQAFEILKYGECRLVISDWEMPEINGLELCQMIRKNASVGYIYVILLTSHTEEDDVVKGLSAGADDFIVKPFNPAELIVRVRAGQRVLSLETRDIAIFALAKLTESRDPETGAHLERVQNYCRVLARHLYQNQKYEDVVDLEYTHLIYLTSPLHDIGKVGIPDSVLLKEGQLSNREFDIMKSHTLLGAETLDAALKQYPDARFLQMARDIALSHHEWYDGNGYPNQLQGNDIPLCGRIVALVDVYDALISKRVYKEAFAHDLAQSMIIEESGTHFDPEIVEAFVENVDEFLAIRERFSQHQLISI